MLLVASLILLGLGVILRGGDPRMRRRRRIPSAVVLTVGFALLVVTLMALLEHTFSSSFERFPVRLLNTAAPH
jgi:hypothetical protein